jgi:hypothetical protein
MPEINLTNSAGRDAVVATRTTASPLRVRWVDEQGRQASSKKIVRATMERDMPALLEKYGTPEAVSEALVNEDPEIDTEFFGSFLENTSRVFLNEKNEIVHQVTQHEVLLNPDGSERERRPLTIPEANVATELPLKWSGKLFKKSEVFNKFVFAGMIQIVHVNGLTYDFLFGMAKELAEKESMMLLGAGPKGSMPLVLRRGATPYRGFLEGRIDGDRYALLLHLSNMELKAPKEGEV